MKLDTVSLIYLHFIADLLANCVRSTKLLHREAIAFFSLAGREVKMPAPLNFSSENRSADLTGARPLN